MKKDKLYIRDSRSPIPKSKVVSKVMSANKSKNTKPEVLIRKALWQNGTKGYRLHWKKAPGRPDICWPNKKVAIFINGCFWHRCPHCNYKLPSSNIQFWKNKFEKNIERDIQKNKELILQGWKVLTIWECEIKKDLPSIIIKIQNLINC